MTFKQQLNKKTGIKEELLPSGYQRIGDIIILNLKKEINEKKVAGAVHELMPTAKTIMLKETGITGEYREPHLRKLWGDGTVTIHNEHDCKFMIDVTKVMWAKGNISERIRLAKLIKKNEFIIDFFAGIGYFSIMIGKYSNPRTLISIEKNPNAFKLLKENIKINKLEQIITPVLGDSKVESLNYKNKADRVIMGLIPAPKEFIEEAIMTLNKKGIIHYEGITNEGEEEILLKDFEEPCKKLNCESKLINIQKIKSYAPKRAHIRIDVLINKK